MQSLVSVCVLLLIASVHGRVTDTTFEECKKYFYNNFVPRGLNSDNNVYICQYFCNKSHFATLYDTMRRIPVYSAYVFERSQTLGRVQSGGQWFVEPQLVDESWNKNIMTAERVKENYNTRIDIIGQRQAVDEDYSSLSNTYNHGHLNPKSHNNGDSKRATFTLTNVVPQNAKLNRDAWSQYENKLKNEIFKSCSKAYVLVGAIPSANNLANNRVNIPDYLWHAYCCVDDNNNPVKSGAATAKNTENKVKECSLNSLQQFFEMLNGASVELFNGCNLSITTKGDCASIIP